MLEYFVVICSCVARRDRRYIYLAGLQILKNST